ncbi:hypothetical protein GDO81_017794 [Engystomops pustulosus]|uniref:Uncharacterized protein n=1 Tax=Engystomops pustulosus TaxID=76066 RepID=A0AAV7A2W9_ENGPU|nr:hypothetical protein GDO81_017794 [Engystomops pustulosus]
MLFGSVKLSTLKTPNKHARGLASIFMEKTLRTNSKIDFQKFSNSLQSHIICSIPASSMPHLGQSEVDLIPIRYSSWGDL